MSDFNGYVYGRNSEDGKMGLYEDYKKMHEPKGENLGFKKDDGKVRWSLLPYNTITTVLKVLEFGAAKYAVDNWKHVKDHERRYYDATMRHIEAWRMKETNDPESGLPHLAHAVACLLFLMWFDVYAPEGVPPNGG